MEITTIIPVHSVSHDFSKYFDRAIDSIKNLTVKPDKILIVRCGCPDVAEVLSKYNFDGLDVSIIENTTGKDFQNQINFVVNNHVKTEYFSILEFDDEYTPNWFKSVKEYHVDNDIYLPLSIDTTVDNKFISFVNEVLWSKGFSEVHGYLDNIAAQQYPNYSISGAVIKTASYIRIGGLKKHLKLSFIYEFLLRATYNELKVMTVPKLGYKHTMMREGSLFHGYGLNMPQPEAKFWMETALREYYFDLDREIEYTPEQQF